MDFEKIIDLVKKSCEKQQCTLIAILHILNDNKPVEIDDPVNSPPNNSLYHILFQPTKETPDIFYCGFDIKEDLKKVFGDKETHIEVNCLDYFDDLKDRISYIQNKHAGSFQIVYQSETYTPPPKIQTKINKIGMDISVITDRIYSLEISYEEIKKITKNRPNSIHAEDLFSIVLKNNSYDINLLSTKFSEDGVIFNYAINVNKQYLQDSFNPSGKKQHVGLLEAFEDETLNNELDDMFKSIIEFDEHTLEDKSEN